MFHTVFIGTCILIFVESEDSNDDYSEEDESDSDSDFEPVRPARRSTQRRAQPQMQPQPHVPPPHDFRQVQLVMSHYCIQLKIA